MSNKTIISFNTLNPVPVALVKKDISLAGSSVELYTRSGDWAQSLVEDRDNCDFSGPTGCVSPFEENTDFEVKAISNNASDSIESVFEPDSVSDSSSSDSSSSDSSNSDSDGSSNGSSSSSGSSSSDSSSSDSGGSSNGSSSSNPNTNSSSSASNNNPATSNGLRNSNGWRSSRSSSSGGAGGASEAFKTIEETIKKLGDSIKEASEVHINLKPHKPLPQRFKVKQIKELTTEKEVKQLNTQHEEKKQQIEELPEVPKRSPLLESIHAAESMASLQQEVETLYNISLMKPGQRYVAIARYSHTHPTPSLAETGMENLELQLGNSQQ